MKKIITLCFLLLGVLPVTSQQIFTLDSCRNMAIGNNKQLKIASEKIKVAEYNRKSAFSSFLPNVDLTGAYLYNSRNLSLLDADKFLPVGSFDAGTGGYKFDVVTGSDGKPVIGPSGTPIPTQVAMIPKEAFEFDIRNTFVGAVSLTQPIYMGGKIRAYNEITKFAEKLAYSQLTTAQRDLIFKTDEVYWQVVSLVYKKKLAESYVELLEKLNGNVQSMIAQGVATQSDGLTVAVKLNEGQMTLTKVENGLSLSKMLLAQICGLPIDIPYQLFDERTVPAPIVRTSVKIPMEVVFANRSEILSLEYAAKIYRQKQTVAFSGMLPQVALTGSYLFSNPNVFNGFKNKFDGMFNVGIMVKVPLFHWGDNINKLNAAKAESKIMEFELAEAKENIELQVHQAEFKIREAGKKLATATKNMEKAEENLKNAQVGFKEGVLTTDNVLEAQTAWLQAQSEVIDARIDVRLCEVYLSKALGRLSIQK